MPCVCGDTNCASCGPAQGYDPMFERVCEWLDEEIFIGNYSLPESISIEWFSEFVAGAIGKNAPRYVIESIEKAVHKSKIF